MQINSCHSMLGAPSWLTMLVAGTQNLERDSADSATPYTLKNWEISDICKSTVEFPFLVQNIFSNKLK